MDFARELDVELFCKRLLGYCRFMERTLDGWDYYFPKEDIKNVLLRQGFCGGVLGFEIEQFIMENPDLLKGFSYEITVSYKGIDMDVETSQYRHFILTFKQIHGGFYILENVEPVKEMSMDEDWGGFFREIVKM